MSWGDYVSLLENSQAKCQYAAIYGKAGGVWAESSNDEGKPSDAEIANAVKVISEGSESVQANGFHAKGTKYILVGYDQGSALILQGFKEKNKSLVFALSGQAVIIGYNPTAEIKTNVVRTEVEKMRDHLKNAGY